jgi:predicted nucleotidyltransferase
MNLFLPIHQKLIDDLNHGEVEFLIIGGYSVIFYGYKRSTGDVDIWLKPTNGNKSKLISAFRENGISEASLSNIEVLDFEKHLSFSLWEEPQSVDFLTRINLVQFDEAFSRKIIAEWEGVKFPFIHLDDLVFSKINTGRPKDVADVDELQRINKLKQNLKSK